MELSFCHGNSISTTSSTEQLEFYLFEVLRVEMSPRLLLFFLIPLTVSKIIQVNVEKRTQKNRPDNTPSTGPFFSRINQSLENHEFLYYTGTVFVGTPPKPFTVNFDTGSHLFWITTPNCRDYDGKDCVAQKRKYSIEQSTTGRNLSEVFVTGYADGSTARGFYVSDVLRLSPNDQSIVVPNLVFGAVDLQSGMSDDDADGLFGLSFPVDVRHESLITWLKKNEVLDAPVITIHMPKNGTSAGELVFGGQLGPNKCGPLITTVPANAMHPFWAFRIPTVKLDGMEIDSNALAVSDSGTTLITVESKQFDIIEKKYPLYPKRTNCDGSQVVDLKLDFVIGDKTLTLRGPELLYREDDECSVGITSNSDGSPISWLLGDLFIRNFCTFLNYKEETIGFAASK
ncbi:Rhizopuspepsinogen [Aphelenchoides besseyi]|nr:Rhizopuspepsinogen [Aphelenchoides besseyi]